MKPQLITAEVPCFNCNNYRVTPINLRPLHTQLNAFGGKLHKMIFHAEFICPTCDRDNLVDGEIRIEILPNDINPAL